MSRVIHKQTIYPEGHGFAFSLPKHANFLDIQIQDGNFVVWYEDNVHIAYENGFALFWTGQEFEPSSHQNASYLKSVQDNVGLVWHLYRIY